MTQLFVNNFVTTVAQTVSSSDTFIQLTSVTGLPALTGGDYLLLTLFRKTGVVESGHEVVKVTAINANQLTVVRAVEGAAATLFNTGDFVEARATAGAFSTKADIASPAFTGTVTGITAAMVGAPSGSGTSSGTNTGDQTTITGNAGTATALSAGADRTKLDGIATGANNYAHPANHPPSIITQDASNRFVTDAEKTAWNAKVTNATHTGDVTGATALTITNKVTMTATAPLAVTGSPTVIAGSAVAITHSTADGNLHVPATGTANSGKVLTAGGAPGVFSWTTPAVGGVPEWERFSVVTIATSVAFVSFTGLLPGYAYKFVGHNIAPNYEQIRFNVSHNNGSTWPVGDSDDGWKIWMAAMYGSQLVISEEYSNTPKLGVFKFALETPPLANTPPQAYKVQSTNTGYVGALEPFSEYHHQLNEGVAVNAIKFFMNEVNMTAGSIVCYRGAVT